MKVAFIVCPPEIRDQGNPPPRITEDGNAGEDRRACGVCSSDMPGYVDSLSDEMKKGNPFPRRAGPRAGGHPWFEVGKNVKKALRPATASPGFFRQQNCYAEYVYLRPRRPAGARAMARSSRKFPKASPLSTRSGRAL